MKFVIREHPKLMGVIFALVLACFTAWADENGSSFFSLLGLAGIILSAAVSIVMVNEHGERSFDTRRGEWKMTVMEKKLWRVDFGHGFLNMTIGLAIVFCLTWPFLKQQ